MVPAANNVTFGSSTGERPRQDRRQARSQFQSLQRDRFAGPILTTRLLLAFRPRSRTHTGSSPVRAAAPEALPVQRMDAGAAALCAVHMQAPLPKIDLRPAKTAKLGSREAMPIGAPSAGHGPRPYVARSKGDRHGASLYVGAAGRPAPASLQEGVHLSCRRGVPLERARTVGRTSASKSQP